jgi:hypothetical protein
VTPPIGQAEVETAKKWWDSWLPPEELPRAVVMPGEEFVFHAFAHRARDSIAWHDHEDGTKTAVPVIVVSAHYRSAMGEAWHRTDKAFVLGIRSGEGMKERRLYITDDPGDQGPDTLFAQPYSMSLAT